MKSELRLAAGVLRPVARWQIGLVFLMLHGASQAQYPDWRHSGSLYVSTTPDGANLPASAAETGFPLLVRLHKEFFDFSQAQSRGEDIRFSTSDGTPLRYQVEQWDTTGGTASIWVRIPAIQGNERQEIKMHWGKAGAASESSGPAVFNESNGYLSVWHMNDPVNDETGTLESRDVGTTASPGIVGQARHFPGGKGVFCGDKIASYPSGAASHSSEAWVRAEAPNCTVLGWGNEGGGRGSKVRMQLRSPPHLHIDSDFADVNGEMSLPMAEWIHVAHTYGDGVGRIYINGRLDGSAKPLLAIKSPARLWIGGWYNHYDFIGDIDEVRISSVARSADWMRMQYENQKPLQTLVGPLVQAGNEFNVSQTQLTVLEGRSVTVTARAGGARKLFWIVKADGGESVVAVDRLSFTFNAGRVAGDKSVVLQLKAIYPDGIRTKEIAVSIRKDTPDPVFTLAAPVTWDGRQAIELTPTISNIAQMQSKGAGVLNYAWTVEDMAVIKEIRPGSLLLKRAQNSGKLTVTLAMNNGGAEVIKTARIMVTEPVSDPWVHRMPARDEKPEDNQFYGRDDRNEGTLFYNGTLDQPAESVFLEVYADDRLYHRETAKPASDTSYAFAVKLKPGLIKYKVRFGARNGERDDVLHVAANIVCGDVYLIDGQSNAEATDIGKETYSYASEWIRTYGSMSGGPDARLKLWGNATFRDRGRLQIGYWGMELGRRLVESRRMPVCIINGAVGGTRIDQHQRSPADPEDPNTIYGRLLWRVRQAKLTHGVRGILWHQGENDQGAAGPTGRYGWETYGQYFIEMAGAWKQDYPNIRNYYIFQIWPKACSMGTKGSDNALREVQRTLPGYFSNMGIMSTLGIKPPGGCHYPAAGYAEFARLICPLLERDHHGTTFARSITPPDIKRAYYAGANNDEVALEFDQPMAWNNSLVSQFHLDGVKGQVAEGSAAGNLIRLRLKAPSAARNITYLDSASWSTDNLLYGENGIAALTFWNVPLLADKATR